jgi:ribosomal-protein-alanine N-acetyltransferase
MTNPPPQRRKSGKPAPPPPAPVRGLRQAVQSGPRVFLRHPVGSDLAEYVKLREISEAWLKPWEPTPPGRAQPPTQEDVFDRFLASSNTPDSQRYLLCRRDDGVILGQVSLNQIFRGSFLNGIAGYWLGAPHAGRGYMTEGLGLLLTQAFGPLGLHRVEANIIPSNSRSLAVVKRLGFRFEGLAKRYLNIDHRWQDHEHWAITAEEWPASTPRRR